MKYITYVEKGGRSGHKLKDIFSELFLCSHADHFIKSAGGFSNLLEKCHKNKLFIDKFYK